MDRVMYKLHPEYTDYIVGSDGTVWSTKNGILRQLRFGGKPDGYRSVTFSSKGRTRTRLVHLLVLELFCGPRPDGFVCRHLDGNCQNNHIDNLVWGTHDENAADRRRHGTQARGERQGISVLTESDIVAIRWLCKVGLTQKQIADAYRVDRSTVGQICSGKTWQHVPESSL